MPDVWSFAELFLRACTLASAVMPDMRLGAIKLPWTSTFTDVVVPYIGKFANLFFGTGTPAYVVIHMHARHMEACKPVS